MSLIAVGKILSPHGLQGAVKVKSFTENPLTLLDFPHLLDDQGNERFKIRRHRPAKEKASYIVLLEGVTSRTLAEPLQGQVCYVTKDMLPSLEGESDTFYCSDLIGLEAKELESGAVGVVRAVHRVGDGDVLEILPQDREKAAWLIPFTHAFVPEVLLTEKRIYFRAWDRGEKPDDRDVS